MTIDGKTYGIAPYVQSEIDHIRKHGLFTPRDFDVSPYFAIVKPTLAAGFDYHQVAWAPPGQALPRRPTGGRVTEAAQLCAAAAIGCGLPSASTRT